MEKCVITLGCFLPVNGVLSARSSDTLPVGQDPVLIKQNNTFYIFCTGWSIFADYCCRDEKSTYKMRVGRSENVYGPYVDRDGVPMNLGGSTVLEGDKNWYGVGHNAVVYFNDRDYLVFHGYDAHDNGKPKLGIEELGWETGFPQVKFKQSNH